MQIFTPASCLAVCFILQPAAQVIPDNTVGTTVAQAEKPVQC